MNREIKFRAWYGGAMTEVGTLDFFENGQVHVNEELVGAIIMQFTGLKDKNGKEIYDGDIVKDADIEFLREVFWDEELCGFSTKSIVRNGVYQTPLNILEAEEIIGNIHENPELLA